MFERTLNISAENWKLFLKKERKTRTVKYSN